MVNFVAEKTTACSVYFPHSPLDVHIRPNIVHIRVGFDVPFAPPILQVYRLVSKLENHVHYASAAFESTVNNSTSIHEPHIVPIGIESKHMDTLVHVFHVLKPEKILNRISFGGL